MSDFSHVQLSKHRQCSCALRGTFHIGSDGRVIAVRVKATLFYGGSCVFSLAPFWKAMVATHDKYLRVGAELARHRAALTVVLTRLGHTFSRSSSRCPGASYVHEGRRPRARPETFFLAAHTAPSCSCLGLRMSAKLSAQHVLRAFFTTTID